MSSVDLVWLIFIGTLTIVLISGSLIFLVILNQRRAITAQRECLRESERLQAVLRAIPLRILRVQEEERGRVARELHDGINQMLASIKYRLHTFKMCRAEVHLSADEWIDDVTSDLDRAIIEIKRISHGLRPKIIEDLGLAAAVREMCDRFATQSPCTVECYFEQIPSKLPPDHELAIYRILQESLHNIEQHSGAKRVTIETRQDFDAWSIRIRDDGRGYSTDNGERASGQNVCLGLATMQERAALIGGTLELHSTPSRGTEIVLTLRTTAIPPQRAR